MGKHRVTVSLDEDVATYLDTVPNRSALVAEAIRVYRARQLERELEAAYRAGREESLEIATEWETTDADLDE